MGLKLWGTLHVVEVIFGSANYTAVGITLTLKQVRNHLLLRF